MARGECPVCLERYDAAARAPMVSVACGHSVCAHCADTLLARKSPKHPTTTRRHSRRDPTSSRRASARHFKQPHSPSVHSQNPFHQNRLLAPTTQADIDAERSRTAANVLGAHHSADSSDNESDHGHHNRRRRRHQDRTHPSNAVDFEDIDEDDDSISQDEDQNHTDPDAPRCPTCSVVLTGFVKNFEALHALQSVADSQLTSHSPSTSHLQSKASITSSQSLTAAGIAQSASVSSMQASDNEGDSQRHLVKDAASRSRPLLEDVADVEHVIDPTKLEFTRAASHELGVGSTGVVYRGTYKSVPVAIKCVRSNANNPANAERFRRELQLISRLSHPHIVDFVGVAWDEGNDPAFIYSSSSTAATPTVLLVTELMHGGTLRTALSALPSSSAGGLEVRSFLKVATHVARGLVYLHAEGFAHRDIKSANILLTHTLLPNSNSFPPETCAKIADFGLSKHLDKLTGGAAYQQSAMEPGRLEATYAYLAPEAFGGDKKNAINPSSDDDDGKLQETAKKRDIYALGVLFWEMITGLVPWAGTSLPDVYVRVCVRSDRPAPSLEDSRVPRTLRRLVDRCWAQDPSKRPSASSIVDKLERIAARLDNSSKHDAQPHTVTGASLYASAPVISNDVHQGQMKPDFARGPSREMGRVSSAVDQSANGVHHNRRSVGSRPQTPVRLNRDVKDAPTSAVPGSIATASAHSASRVTASAVRTVQADETCSGHAGTNRESRNNISRLKSPDESSSTKRGSEQKESTPISRLDVFGHASQGMIKPSAIRAANANAAVAQSWQDAVPDSKRAQPVSEKLVQEGNQRATGTLGSTQADYSAPVQRGVSSARTVEPTESATLSASHPTYASSRAAAGRQSPVPVPVSSSVGRYSVTQKYAQVSSGTSGPSNGSSAGNGSRKIFERISGDADSGRRTSDPNDPLKKRQTALISAAFERSPSYAGPATTSGALANPSGGNTLPGVVAVSGQPRRPATRRMVSMEGVGTSSVASKRRTEEDDDEDEFGMATVVSPGDELIDEDPNVAVSHMSNGELLSTLSQRSNFPRVATVALAALECPRHRLNEEIVRNACAVLHQLTVPMGGSSRDSRCVSAKEQIVIRKYLKSNHGVAALLRVIRVPNNHHPTTLSYALLALGNLTAWDLDAHKDFRESDGVTCISDCMVQHSDNMGVQEKGCYAIACTAATYSTKAKVAFLQSDCISRVVSALSRFLSKNVAADAVTKQACAALGAMCSSCPDNAAQAGSIGALSLLISAFDAFRQSSRVEGGKRSEMNLVCMAYMNLMCAPDNRRQVNEHGGLALILRSTRIFRLDGEFVEKALNTLSQVSTIRANALQIVQLNGVDDIIASMVRFKLSVPVQKHGIKTLSALMRLAGDHARRRIVQASGAEAIIFALERFGSTFGEHAELAVEGCRAIAVLCTMQSADEGDILSKRMKKIRADRALKQTIQAHRGNQQVQERGKEALKNLSSIKHGSSWLHRIRHKAKS